MIVVKRRFRTVLAVRGDITMRVCTGECINGLPHDDDRVTTAWGLTPEDLLIHSRKDVTAVAKTAIRVTWALAVAAFISMCCCLWSMYSAWLSAGRWFPNWSMVAAALCAVCFVVFFRQGATPIVHDNSGHWVNLRTGSSNLCGGIVIRKRARWP